MKRFNLLAAIMLVAAPLSCGVDTIPESNPDDTVGAAGGSDTVRGGGGGGGGMAPGGAGTIQAAGAGAGGAGATSGLGTGGAGTGGSGGPVEPGVWVNATGNLANLSSVCGNSYRVWSVPETDMVLAAISRVGIYATRDGGTTWALLGGASSPNNDQNGILFDPEDSRVFWVAGMHTGPGVFKTVDGGTSFTTLGGITNIDDISVDFTDPLRKTIIAGAHEQHLLYKSTNGGASFTNITSSFPAGPSFTLAPIVIDANTYIMGTAYYSADPSVGVFRTTDGGATWTRLSTVSVGSSGLKTSWGTLFFGSRSGGSILRGSADGSTWTTLPLAGNQAYSVVVELPGNRIATTTKNGNVSRVVVSEDDGNTWQTIADDVPSPVGWSPSVGPYLAYNAVRDAFFVSYWDCGTRVRPDAIWRYDLAGAP